jgi:glutamate-ammonia-ligase adenylyltransferase
MLSFENSRPFLASLGLRDLERGFRNVRGLARGLGEKPWADLLGPLSRILPESPDPDMSLNNLDRFLDGAGGAKVLPALLEGRARTLEILLHLLGTSQFFSDLLCADPDYLDMLRVPLRGSPDFDDLQHQLQSEIDAALDDATLLAVFRRFRQRQMLRIGTNDIIRDRPLEEITRDLSRVADVALDSALTCALRRVSERLRLSRGANGPGRCVILAFGKLGGQELNYSSDIDLMFLYDEDGILGGARASNLTREEFYGRVVTEVVRLLSAHTDRGQAYRTDLRLRPEGERGPLARSLASTLRYYDAMGRTWERQALIKVRPVAGDHELGAAFQRAIEPFVYRKYLSYSEINEIKAIKRRIEHKAGRAGVSESEVKTGHGGIRDIEFSIQFLQLLNGGELPSVRQANTLLALQALAEAGCLSDQEYQILESAYRFLRKTEHRLQLMFDWQTHRLPEGEEELRKLARRMGYEESSAANVAPDLPDVNGSSLAQIMRITRSKSLLHFLSDYREKTRLNRKILEHLLHETFQGEDSQAEPESDLILDTVPDPETIKQVLGRYPFHDVQGAYQNLTQLAREEVPFLSARRCRHFLASIAPSLLKALADTPDPDMALINLEKVTASLGAKAVLWELFSFHPPSLKLYVELCAWSQFLSSILINNPGMIDDLLDSLVLNQPRSQAELRQELADLCRGASDAEPIWHSFQGKELLRIGVRDILSKDTIQETTLALSDLAETLLGQVATLQEQALAKRFGTAYLSEGPRAGQPSRYVLLALGKLGGREMSYHSDLDLILVYEGDGTTGRSSIFDHRSSDPEVGRSKFEAPLRSEESLPSQTTDNFHFYTELAQRIIRVVGFMGPLGRLYQVDMRLRPTGKSGSLVCPLREFRRYYEQGGAQVWERQALTRARVVHGDEAFGREVMEAVQAGAYGMPWRPDVADAIIEMRGRLQASRSERDLKRGFGGIVDVEFLVQLFQIKFGQQVESLRVQNTWKALDALLAARLLDDRQYAVLRQGYDFLRTVESRLRIVHNVSIDELPEDTRALEKLARRLGCENGPGGSAVVQFLSKLDQHTSQIRELFSTLSRRERDGRSE